MSNSKIPVLAKVVHAPSIKRPRAKRLIARWVPTGPDVQSRNIRNVVIDSIGVGFASAAAPFLPVFLARLGASDFAVGLLTAMPAFAGFLFALPVGQFLAHRRQIVPWFSGARLMVLSSYALTGLAPFIVSDGRVNLIILIWALATLPQTVVNVAFTLVMAGVAGPQGRLFLMSRRWSTLGVTTSLTVAVVGFVLDRIAFPVNYQVVFLALSLGGLVSYYFSSHITLPDQDVAASRTTLRLSERTQNWLRTVRGQNQFVRFTLSQFIYRFGLALAIPLFPLYYVRELHANDASIGLISTVGSGVLIVAYVMWTRVSKRRGVRFALLVTTFAISFYPIVLSFTKQIELVILLAGVAGTFMAGIDLIFFDVLVSSFPAESSAMYVGLYQTTVYVATFAGPLVGTTLSSYIGIPGALIAAGVIRFAGFLMFLWLK